MSRTVWLTDGAARDLDELYAAAYDRGGAVLADRILDRIQSLLERLADDNAPGAASAELRRLGIGDGHLLRDGELRLLYRHRGDDVLLVLIADRARSLQSLLQRRVLDS